MAAKCGGGDYMQALRYCTAEPPKLGVNWLPQLARPQVCHVALRTRAVALEQIDGQTSGAEQTHDISTFVHTDGKTMAMLSDLSNLRIRARKNSLIE